MKHLDFNPSAELRLALAWHEVRLSNRARAAVIISSLGDNNHTNHSAATLVGMMQAREQNVGFAGLQNLGLLMSTSAQLAQLNAGVGGGLPASALDKHVTQLRERAAVHHMQTASSSIQGGSGSPPPRNILTIERVRPYQPKLPANLPPKPLPGQPVSQVAAFLEREGEGFVLNLAGQDLRSVHDLAGQIKALQDLAPGLRFNFSEANLSGINLSGLTLRSGNFTKATLIGTNLSESNLHAASFVGANLSQANLSNSTLTANFDQANLTSATLDRANLVGAGLHRATLVGASLVDAELYQADLREAKLTGSNLTLANLNRANMEGVVLVGVQVNGASFFNADLSDSVVTNVDFSKANLTQTIFTGAKITDVNFVGAKLNGVVLTDTNQTRVVWPTPRS